MTGARSSQRVRAPAAATAARAGLAAFLTLLAAACGGGQVPVPPALTGPTVPLAATAFTATVVRVVDGDTIIARRSAGGARLRVRIVGIDTPESVKPGEAVACFGHQASAFTQALLPAGSQVRAAYETDHQDRYQRELWDVWLPDGRSLESVLLASGVARVDPFPPNTDHADVLADAAAGARAAGRGLWGACGFSRAFPDQARQGVGPDG